MMLLTILTALTGFAAPFIPELVKYFNSRQDQKFELERMRLSAELADKEHLLRIEELRTQGDIEELKAIRAPQSSFGVQLIDAAKDSGWGKWALMPSFYAFVLADVASAMVRPTVTYAFVTFYIIFKIACFQLMDSSSDGTFTWAEGVTRIWDDFDRQMLVLVISFWFGTRARKAEFGGSASTGKPGA